MSENKKVDSPPETDLVDVDIAESPGEVSSVVGSVKNTKHHSSTSERQIKFERAQKCLENAALVSKRIKEHRKAAAELLGKPFDDDCGDTASEMATTISERTGYSVATEKSTLSVQDALNIPGISESLANTLKQKELLMERIKQYKEISRRPGKTSVSCKKDISAFPTAEVKKQTSDNADIVKLMSTVKEKENALSVMQVKIRAMETTILDLQEKINEKDQIIEAKNMATTLISDSLSKKEKGTMDLLEDTRQQMTKMQEHFAAMESEWKEEKNRLCKQIDEKTVKINSLQEANSILENSRFEISLSHSKLSEELALKNEHIVELQNKIEALYKTNLESQEKMDKIEVPLEEEKGTLEIAEMAEMTKKIEILEQLNFQIRQTNKDLENQLAAVNSETKVPASSSLNKKGSPVSYRKGARNTRTKSPWSNLSSETTLEPDKKVAKNDIAKLEMMLQALNKDILEKEYLLSQKELMISQLESSMTEKETTIQELQSLLESQNKAKPEMVNVGIDNGDLPQSEQSCLQVLSSNLSSDVSLLDIKDLKRELEIAQDQIITLNKEIEAANKNMVKVKSHSKLKIKQLQKTIDSFSKVSDANAEIVKLNEELHQLSQKVAELEEEKGNLQLHLVDYDSGRLTESDVYKKLVEMENLAETRLKSISILETQKFDLVQELHVLQQKNIELEDKLADMSQIQNEQVCSEIKSVQMEEQMDELIASKKELELVIDNLKLDREQSFGTIEMLQGEKEELIHKLENYIQENMELTDKLEKLSAEKVSSAESIEIVESLTTQEKLELEEYNKGLDSEKISGESLHEGYKSDICDENIESLVKQKVELNEKVEMFTNERQEVMDKMSSIIQENESLQDKIIELNSLCESLRGTIDILTEEKTSLQSLNQDLIQQIEELKNERLEIMKETVEIVKPLNLDENVDNVLTESHDEKSAADKINSRFKSVKQLTKEILKLKNTIKEREAEIADCQMKILSLEENQEKQRELIQNSASYEEKIKQLSDENNQLKYEMEKATELQHERAQMNEDNLQEGILKLRQEYSAAINARDTRIHELENLLNEYEKQILNYVNTLQQKDKEINEYINQITKLNDVSHKLKSTIELLEEEKTKDQNIELVKSLNKQISIYQKTLSEYEEKLKILDEEKSKLASLKSMFENKINTLESEIKKMEVVTTERETIINELKMQHQKQVDELSTVKIQAKEQDEEIHEIKLQLRRESIENEKLRTLLQQKDDELEKLSKMYETVRANLDISSNDYRSISEQYAAMEQRNKELIEKLKKFAVSIKKKNAMYIDLESHLKERENILESKDQELQDLRSQFKNVQTLQESLKQAEEQLKIQTNDKIEMGLVIKKLEDELFDKVQDITKLNLSLDMLNKELESITEENENLKTQVEYYSKKIAECEIDQKNNSNFLTKISCLELDLNEKHSYIEELLKEIRNQEEKLNQIESFHGAKVQASELYIENLQSEIEKNMNRIARLEETISMMEDSRISVEGKANQLDNQLQEKRQAYSQYSDQEDELVSRLAYLMENHRQIEKQLYETDMENQELQFKIQNINETNSELQNSYTDLQDYCKVLEFKANRVDTLEAENANYVSKTRDFEAIIKRLTAENQTLTDKRKSEMDYLESEFNTQIETAIKEKKILSDKYEKLCEQEEQLKLQLQEYHTNLEKLQTIVKELSTENQKLLEKSNTESRPDYTDQYINEINKLNSIINSKNEEIIEISNKIQVLQNNHALSVTNFETKILDLNNKLQNFSSQTNKYLSEIDSLKLSNEELSQKLQQKEDQIKHLTEKKKLFFEMNIPKTEGLTISSTIEDVCDDQKSVEDLQSQIVTDADMDHIATAPEINKTVQMQLQHNPQLGISSEAIVEPPMVSKKSYLCYDKEEIVVEESDPFNSDEGWGVDTMEEKIDVTPGLSHLNKKIQLLDQEKQHLKANLETTNIKLRKAIKKLKELKVSNDILSNELNISKQISQNSMMDMAIESEMSNNLKELEKNIQELNNNLLKEKSENEALKKQNEVLKNAHDRLVEMKEKMDNEIELWKFNFKQANDKLSSLQYGTENKEYNANSATSSKQKVEPSDDIIKLEKENDELQNMVDSLNLQNNHLSSQLVKVKEMLHSLEKESNKHPTLCEECEKYKMEINHLLDSNRELNESNITLNTQIEDLKQKVEDGIKSIDAQKASDIENEKKIEDVKNDLQKKISILHDTVDSYKKFECDANNTIASLTDELEKLKTKLVFTEEHLSFPKDHDVKVIALEEKTKQLEKQYIELQDAVQSGNDKIKTMEAENYELTQKIKTYEEEINVLNAKLHHLNIENDQLLSTVAELRASVSSAVDQRGYEIAELWKQHLMQREGEFQKIEQDLRSQLDTAESKYEQLLENMQSSDTNDAEKISMVEQLALLQNKIQIKEEHLISLQSKYADLIHQLEMLRSEMQDEKHLQENKMLTQQEEYENNIKDLNMRINDLTKDFQNAAKIKESELLSVGLQNENLNKQIEEIRKSFELKIADLNKQIQIKDSEIFQKTHEFSAMLTQKTEEFEFLRLKLLEYEKKIEDLGFEKESELAVLRLKMHDTADIYERNKSKLEDENKNLAEALNSKIIECTNLNKIITDLKKSLQEYSLKIAEAQAVLENQELEIVTLKEEISHLNDMMRSNIRKTAKHVSFASNTKHGLESETSESSLHNDLLDAVPRAELDLALYMLHQRDVRCEELTMELTQLLEERDTLQLRLSDSLRSIEEFKSKSTSGLDIPAVMAELPTTSEKEDQLSERQRPQTSRSSSISDYDADKPKLEAKLSELRSVKQSRDVRLRNDSEQRQLGMRLLQRDVANLPPEAVDQLAQAHHTLTRDSQSTPTVLLNWLRGKSTPKVVHM